ncbi:DUF2798 domain-containing protein [Cupriavidus necator]
MHSQLKRKVAFGLSMGIATTGISSFVHLALNLGFSEGFTLMWLSSWGIGYATTIPVILLVGPHLQTQIDRLIH